MSRRGWLLFAAMGVLWGIPYMFIKVAVRELSPADIVFGRTMLAALLLLPVAIRRRALSPALRHWRWVVVFAITEIAIPWYLIVQAERRLPSALVGMLISLVPLFSTLLTWAFLDRQVIDRGRATGLVVGVLGVGLLLGLDALLQPLDGWSVLAVVVCALLYAVAPIVADRRLGEAPSVGVITLSLLLISIIYLPLAVLSRPKHLPSGAALVSVATLGVLCTAAAFVLFFSLIAEVGPVRASVITFVNPAVAVVLGVAVLSEALTWGTVIGFPTVLVGSWLATRASRGPTEVKSG